VVLASPLYSDRRLHIALALVMGLGVVSHLALLLHDFRWGEESALILLALVWVALPWVLIWVCSRLARGRSVASWMALGLAVLYLVLGTWAYWYMVYIYTDVDGGLVFAIVPELGVLAALVLMAGLWLSRPRHPAPL